MLQIVIVETRYNVDDLIENHLNFLPECHVHHFKTLKINSEKDYNLTLTNPLFWHVIKEENILIIQHDSGLLRTGIEDFYEYDYVGAPWKFQEHGGNGGLSFRKKSAMLECIDKVPYNGIDNEDVYFCNALKFLNKNIAPREVCEKFSCESIFKLGTLGYHAIDKWLLPEECEQIKNQYN